FVLRCPPRSPLLPYTTLFRSDPGPGFSEVQLDELLAQLPSPGAKRVWHQVARVALALVGVVQVALGALPLVMPSSAGIDPHAAIDRKSTRLNSSHQIISYPSF